MSLQESANKSKQLIQNQTDMDNANNTYEPNYKQVFFPFNPDYVNAQFIAMPTTMPNGGKHIENANTEPACKQNAAFMFSENNKINFNNTNFNEGAYQTSINSDGQTEIKGALLPLNGNQNVTVKITGPTVFSLWIDMATINPLASNTHKTPFIVWKHVPVNFLLRYRDFSGTPIITLQTVSGAQVPTKSGQPVSMPKTPVYYNFNNETKQCTLFKGDISVNEQNDVILWSKPIMSDATVGLNELGQLMMYNKDGKATLLFGEEANAAKNDHQLVLNSITGTLQLRNTVIARGLDVAGADESAWPQAAYNGVLTSKQKTANGMRLPEQQITEKQGLTSADNKLLFIIENNALVIKKRMKNAQSIFSIQPDYKMGKTFLTDANADIKKIIYMDAKSGIGGAPSMYKNAYPPKNAVKSGAYKETTGACDASKLTNYTHYYEVTENNTKKCLTPANQNTEIQFLSKNDAYTSSTMYKPVDAIKNVAQETDGYVLNDTTNFSLLNTPYKSEFNLNYLIPEFKSLDKKTKAAYGIKTTDLVENKVMSTITYEGFETQQETVIKNIDTNIVPVYSSIYGNIAKINQNVQDISAGIQQYRDSKAAMEGSELVDGITKDKYYEFSLEKPRSKTAALLKDRETMLTEQNNLYIVSVISVAALFIGAIVVSTSNE